MSTKRSPWIHLAEFVLCYSLVLIPMLFLAHDRTDGDEFYKSLPGILPKLLDLMREFRQS